jgi:hypothetical protein
LQYQYWCPLKICSQLRVCDRDYPFTVGRATEWISVTTVWEVGVCSV